MQSRNNKKLLGLFFLGLFCVSIVLLIGYQFKDSILNDQQTPDDSPLMWPLLEEGWRAMKNNEDGESVKQLRSMEGKDIALYGYMLPIKSGERHDHFLLSSRNHSCPFCMPATAGNLVEVHSNEPLPYQNEAYLLRGIFHIIEDEHSELMYSITHAHPVEKQ